MVANTYRIIVETSELSKNNWNLIYRFIEKCYGRGSFGKEDFDSLKEQAKIVIDNNPKDEDVYSCDGLDEIQFENLTENQNDWMFNIIYKAGDKEDFGDLVPFFLLKKKYRENITFGIDVENVIKQNNYTFKCSIFLFFIKDKKPKIGNHSIYFIHEFDTKTGEIRNVSALKYTQKENDYSKASPNFIPLLHINEENFKLFQHANDVEIPLCKYISESIKKSKLDKNINFSSKFEEWFIKAYCSNCNITTDFEQFKPSLHDYYINIYELVQNIIFHAQGRGLLYINFNKKEDMLKDGKILYPYCNIPDIDTYENTQRFLEIGIYDYSEKGIENTSGKPLDFWFSHSQNPNAQHMGIWTFVNSVIKHGGYFKVETNNGDKGEKHCLNSHENFKVDETENIEGTHYDIIFPIFQKKREKKHHEQTQERWIDVKKEYPDIISIENLPTLEEKQNNDDKKKYQEDYLKTCANEIVDKIIEYKKANFAAIDINLFKNKVDNLTSNIIHKILYYLNDALKKCPNNKYVFIFTNLDDELMDDFLKSVIENPDDLDDLNKKYIFGIVLITKELRIQIIPNGDQTQLQYVNAQISRHYGTQNFLYDATDESRNNWKDDNPMNELIIPYELLIKTKSGTLFCDYLKFVLERPLGQKRIGCKQKLPYAQVGDNIIIEKYYEADFLFQNSFFVERFAFLISNRIWGEVKENHDRNNIVLVGYNNYSNMLLDYIKKYLEDKSNKSYIIKSITANSNANDKYNMNLAFDIDIDFKSTKSYVFVIIPISSTLRTHDLIVTSLKEKFNVENTRNYTVILIRDKNNNTATVYEKKYGWEDVDQANRIINTNFSNAKTIEYIAENDSGWHHPLESDFFPQNYWWDEKPMNQTCNASLNSRHVLSYPQMGIPSNFNIKDNNERLNNIKDYLLYGHIENGNIHQKYYILTNDLVKNKKEKINSWLVNLNDSKNGKWKQKYNILITPKNEENFTHLVNDICFGGNAETIIFDIKSSRFNIQEKYAHLKEKYNKNISFHFVNHVMLTAETYYYAKDLLRSIFPENNVEFNSIFTLVCRLYEDKYKEISKNTGLHAFVYLFVPSASAEIDCNCSLCEYAKRYRLLKNNSTIYKGRKRIETETDKLELSSIKEIKTREEEIRRIEEKDNKTKEDDEKIKKYRDNKNRHWNRLMAKHDIFYQLSILSKNDKNSLDERLDKLFKECNDEDIDRKISLIKVLSLPELSQYVPIRYYIHKKLLNELKSLFDKTNPNNNDLKLLKVLLKQMSLLGMNALVRKEVITQSWLLYFKVVKDTILEKTKLIKEQETQCHDFAQDFHFFIKNAIFENEARAFWLGELLRTDEEKNLQLNNIKVNPTTLLNSLFELQFPKSDSSSEIKYKKEYKRSINWLKYIYKREYKRFLMRLFYDNTTIIRKTLNNFDDLLNKESITFEKKLYDIFFDNNGTLKEYSGFLKNKDDTKQILEHHISKPVFYWLRFYIKNNGNTPDNVDLIGKLAHVLYAKHKLDDITPNDSNSNHDIKGFQENAQQLLQVFVQILDSEGAFVTVKHKDRYSTIATTPNVESYNFDYKSKNFICKGIDDDVTVLPIRMREKLCDYEEKKMLDGKAKKAVCFILKGGSNDKDCVFITFLFDDDTPNNNEFKIRTQEHCRLLLLLTPELNKYIEHIQNEKTFDLWREKEEKNADFIKVHIPENHGLELIGWSFGEMKNEIENEEEIRRKTTCWFMLSNMVIKHLYAQLLQYNEIILFPKYFRSFSPDKVFDSNFTNLIDQLYHYRWEGSELAPTNFDPKYESTSFNGNISIHIPIIQSFIIQCLDNAFRKYRDSSIVGEETRVVKIKTYQNNEKAAFVIEIINVIGISISDDNRHRWEKEMDDFNRQYNSNNISKSEIRNYRFTLISLIKYIDAINKNFGANYSCERSFKIEENKPTFRIVLTFNY